VIHDVIACKEHYYRNIQNIKQNARALLPTNATSPHD